MKQMKKYLAIFAVLFTVILSSCSNDNIPVDYAITFKVDPSTVISSYEEYNIGDLTSLGPDFQLRIRLLVYNESGLLVTSDEAFSSDYTHVQTFSCNLSEGKYTIVAITDVVGKSSSSVNEFYTLSDQEKLNTTKLTYGTLIGGSLAILGLTTESQYLSSSSDDINIKVKPAGALIVCHIDDWNSCLDYNDNGVAIDVETFKLLGNQISSDLILNSYGEPTYSIKSSSDYDYIWYKHMRNSQYKGGYGYSFKFPMTNVKLRWVAETANNRRYSWGEPAAVNIEAGKEYYFELDVANDEAGWYDLGVDARSSGVIQKADSNNEYNQMNVQLKIEDEPISVKAIDYLKQK